MGAKPIPIERQEAFIADCLRGMSTNELTTKYDRAGSTVRQWRIDLRNRGLLPTTGVSLTREVPIYDKNVDLPGDAIVVGDLEIPYHDADLLSKAMAIGKRFNVHRLVIAGDFVAMDAFSTHPHEDSEEERYSLNDSLQDGGEVLSDLFEWFSQIVMIKGNHEQRADRRRELEFFRLMQDRWGGLGDLTLSYYKWCLIHGYRIEHPSTYSKVPGTIARERAEIENCSTIEAHCHHLSLSWTKNGKYQAADLGHCTRPETRHYKTVNGTGRYPKWVAGFWMIRNGYLYPFTKLFTDWGFWLDEIAI